MARWDDRRQQFRAQLAQNACVFPASVFDPVSARIAQDVGFEMGILAGSVASQTVLGAPDHIVLTLTEFAGQAHRICRTCDLPIIVDADHGYGNALNVMRTVEELETAGVCGLSIEDTLLPAAFGSGGKATLTSLDEGVGRMRAAVKARADKNLVIAGRTSAVSIAGVDEALARAKAYEAAGVDMLFFIGVKTRDQLDALAAATTLPMIVGGVSDELKGDLDYLSARNVRICLQGHYSFTAAVQAMHATMTALRNGTNPADLEGQPSKELMRKVTSADTYDQHIDEFLG